MKYLKLLFIWVFIINCFSVCFSISPPSLSNAQVRKMCTTAQRLYWEYADHGLGKEYSNKPDFTEGEFGYYYIGTRNDFLRYFMKVFTRNAALQFLEQELKQGLKERDGKLGHPYVGGGSICDVYLAKVTLLRKKGLIREYLIKAPGVEPNDWYKEKVIFKFENQVGWKIDTSPEILGF